MGDALMENRHGLVVDAALIHATGTAEHEATLGCSTGARIGIVRTANISKPTPDPDFFGSLSMHFRVSLNRGKALAPCFIAFSSREPVSTSPENALDRHCERSEAIQKRQSTAFPRIASLRSQ